MSRQEAVEKLQIHGGVASAGGAKGLLASLRPYKGIAEKNFLEVFDCLFELSDSFIKAQGPEKEVYRALWSISATVRLLICESGPLVENKLISPQDLEYVHDWLQTFDHCVLNMLNSNSSECLFAPYFEFVSRHPPSKVSDSLFVATGEALKSSDEDLRIASTKAVGAFFCTATRAAELLRSVLSKENSFQVKEAIQTSLRKLESFEER